jgi:hypothetical protein
MPDRPTKITFADMRDMGVHGLLIYCSDYKCSHLVTISGDRWPTISGSPTSRAASSARPAASAVRMCGPISTAPPWAVPTMVRKF